MPKGSLKNLLLKRYSFEEHIAKTISYINILGIALGMQYLHSKNIVHGNLKLSNIMVDEEYFPHICDFGLFKFTNNDDLNHESISFLAPEILESKIKEPTFKSDVYSYSLIVYLIITEQSPNIEIPGYEGLTNIIKGKRPDISIINNSEIKIFLEQCWSSNPKDRPTFDQIISILTNQKFCSIFNIYMPLMNKYLGEFIQQRIIRQLCKELNNKTLKSSFNDDK